MPYMMGGYPDRETSLAVAAAYVDSGADLIELGVPFSDPLADGPTIHAAGDRGAGGRGDLGVDAGGLPRRSRDRVPVVLMAYSNMVLAHGGAGRVRRLARRRRGGRGDRPRPAARARPGESRDALDAAGLALVPLVAPTTPAERRARICAAARGFVYVVSTVGTTGERGELPRRAARSGRSDQGRCRGARSRSASGSARPSRRRRSGESPTA